MELLDNLTPLLVAVLGAGGIVGGIVALMKLRPEAGQIVVNAAQDALIVQSGVLEALLAENRRLIEKVAAVERENTDLLAKMTQMATELHDLKLQVAANYAADHPDRWRDTRPSD
jgi:hypothetical protein